MADRDVQAEIVEIEKGYAMVKLRRNGRQGLIPTYFLEPLEIPGATFADQIR